jgi:hypothetical protein
MMTLNYITPSRTPARIMLIVPRIGESKHVSISDSEYNEKRQAYLGIVLSKQIKSSCTVGDGGSIGSVNHCTTLFARLWYWRPFISGKVGENQRKLMNSSNTAAP